MDPQVLQSALRVLSALSCGLNVDPLEIAALSVYVPDSADMSAEQIAIEVIQQELGRRLSDQELSKLLYWKNQR